MSRAEYASWSRKRLEGFWLGWGSGFRRGEARRYWDETRERLRDESQAGIVESWNHGIMESGYARMHVCTELGTFLPRMLVPERVVVLLNDSQLPLISSDELLSSPARVFEQEHRVGGVASFTPRFLRNFRCYLIFIIIISVVGHQSQQGLLCWPKHHQNII